MTTPLSDADLKQIWARWEKGIETAADIEAAGDDIPHLLVEVERLRAENARLMTGLTDIGQVATYPADTGYAERDPWDVLWAIAQATCQLTCGKAHKLWETTNDDATE